MIIRQSTARTILVGPVLDSTGAAKTDEVVGNIKVTKNGTVGAADGSATLTHDHAGKYKLALTANDCDTVGVLEISLNSGTNDMPVKACNVVETAIWDALFADGATGLLPANVTHFGGNAGTFSSGVPTAALDSASRDAVADAVWDEAMSGHTTNGTYGGRIVRAANSNVEVQITGSQHVAADVHEFQTGVITAGDFASNSLTAAALAADAVAEIQNGLSTLTAPEVNAEVVDALSVDTYAELTAPPAATSSLKDKLTWLFMYARNKVTQTATQRKLYRDDGSTVAGTSGTSDDGTTFTKGEDA